MARLAWSWALLSVALGWTSAGCTDGAPGDSSAGSDDDAAGVGDDDAVSDDDAVPDDDAAEDEEGLSGPPYTVEATLSSDAVEAGGAVEVAVVVRDAGGDDVTASVDAAWSVEPPTGVQVAGDEVSFTVAGAYAVWTRVAWDGGVAEDIDPVQVHAGPPAAVTLALDRARTIAGEAVHAEVAVRDAYGNALPSDVLFTVEPSEGVSIDGFRVTPTRTGDYLVTAHAGGGTATASAAFGADPGPAATVTLTLPADSAEVGDGLVLSVDQRDSYGNAAEDPLAVSTAPPAGAAAWDHFVRFDAEGRYEISVSSTVTGASDTAGPVVVDSSGPVVSVTNPARGGQLASGYFTVIGSVTDAVTGVAGLEVDGQDVSPEEDGAFYKFTHAGFGLETLDVVAWDGDGNTSDAAVSYLAGGFHPEGEFLGDALVARISEQGIQELEDVALGALDIDALLSGIATPGTPVFSTGDCLAGVELYVESVSVGETRVDLDPRSGGYIQLSASVDDLAIDYDAEYELLCFIGGSAEGTVSADSMDISARLTVAASGGTITAWISDVSATFHGFDISGDLESEIISLFDGFIQDYAEEAVVDAIESEIGPLLAGLFSSLALSTTFDLMGTEVTLDALPSMVGIDETGLTIALESRFTAPAYPGLPALAGSLWREPTWPDYGASPAMQISISDNFLNQMLTGVWRAGALNMSLAGEELGLDLSGLGDVLDLGTLEARTAPLLPPVLVPAGNGLPEYELQIGEMGVQLWGDPGGSFRQLADIRVGMVAPAALSMADGALGFGIGDPTVWFDVVAADGGVDRELLEGVMEELLSGLLPELLGMLGDLGALPIPEISGFTLLDPTLRRDDDPHYYLTLAGGVDISLDL